MAESTPTSQRALQERTLQGCPQNKTTSEVMSSTEAKNTATVLAMHAKGWGVPGRQWRNVTYEGMTFSESQIREDH